jgi:hypothetical protein
MTRRQSFLRFMALLFFRLQVVAVVVPACLRACFLAEAAWPLQWVNRNRKVDVLARLLQAVNAGRLLPETSFDRLQRL